MDQKEMRAIITRWQIAHSQPSFDVEIVLIQSRSDVKVSDFSIAYLVLCIQDKTIGRSLRAV